MTGVTPLPLLVARGVSKSFGAVEALVDVDFDVDAGEVVALVGDNGAGKSTLIKAIAGVQPADAGRLWFDGREVSIRSPQDASRLGIATVYQDLALCDNLDVVGNVYLGKEPRAARRLGVLAPLDEDGMEHRTHDLFVKLAVTTLHDPHAVTGSLSGGQRQAVAIARALVGEPRLLILDEPTAALGVAQTAQVLELIHKLREEGLAVVVISHNLDTVFDVADRIVVLRLGRREATFERRATTREDVVAAIVGAHVQRTEAIARGTTDEHRLTPPMRGQHATRSVVAMSTTTEPAERSRVDDERMGRRLAASHHGSGRRPRDCASAQRPIERRPR